MNIGDCVSVAPERYDQASRKEECDRILLVLLNQVNFEKIDNML